MESTKGRDRAPSTTSTTTAASQRTSGTALGHKRNPSTKSAVLKLSTSSTVITLFTTNLRLLNLDLLNLDLPDWPSITPTTFTQNDARQRIRSTEFALYHLFRLYDPHLTAEKLQPFYPPLEPVQSLNLRAALYRCLNELKKQGVLGKEIVLRKTMLDDCQVEKFWEVCLAFSAVVLRKVMLEKKRSFRERRDGPPIAERLGTASIIGRSQKESLLPLAIAHKAGLREVLEGKQRQREVWGRLYDVLCEKEADLVRRRNVVEEQVRSRPRAAEAKRLKAVEMNVRKSWASSNELRDVLLAGDAGEDSVLTKPLERLAARSENAHEDIGLLETLEQTARLQAHRVRRWQSLHEKFIQSKPAPNRNSTATEAAQLRFEKHRMLSLREASQLGSEQIPQRQRSDTVVSASVGKYDEILTAMREELRRNRRATAPVPPSPSASSRTTSGNRVSKQPPIRKPSVHLDTTAGAQQPPTDIQHNRSPSQTAVPMRPSMSRRVSSRSRSYQAPKVEGQRQPIPLKSEIFSPIKSMRRGSASPRSSSLLTTPVEETTPVRDTGVITTKGVEDERKGSEADADAEGTVDSGIVLSSEPAEIEDKDTAAGSRDEREDTITVPDREFKVPALPPPSDAGKVKSAPRPSLAERTRMSMAFRSSEDINGSVQKPAAMQDNDVLPNGHAEVAEEEIKTSLADRTRQSISNFNPTPSTQHPASKKKTASHTRARSSIYPVNQFDTPKKHSRRSSLALDGPMEVGSEESLANGRDALVARRDITPREQLFSPDAEYDSVFKPRPKVKMSPVLGPQRDTFGGMDEDGGLQGLDGVNGSSPLVGVGVHR